MSLLLDARKKSQQTQTAPDGTSTGLELSLEDFSGASSHKTDTQSAGTHTQGTQPVEHARSAGQNLFDAKSHSPSQSRANINRNLLIALGGTILLLAGGGGYVWYEISGSSQPVRPIMPPAQPAPTPITASPAVPQAGTVSEATPAKIVATPTTTARRAKKSASTPSQKAPMIVEQHQAESIDPLLNEAYQAYLDGKYDQAQPLYQRALRLDARNTDALLGLAAIAQRRGADNIAAHYYAQVLELDPRDAVANAGMSALTTGDNGESRLKILLNEQQDSSALHFALGNRYAGQDRWAEAQQSYFNAYKLAPDNAELAFNLAVSLDRIGQKKLAAQYYRRALELNSPKPGAGSNASFDHAKISQRIEELTH